MFETSDPRARRRLILIIITLATIPCYCIGGIAIMLAPGASQIQSSTETVAFTATQPLAIPTATLGPEVITATPSDTPTVTPSSTHTFTPTMTPSVTMTWTATNTSTATFTYTPSFTPSFTFTPTNTFTPTFTATPVTPTNTLTPSITSFPSP